MATPVRQHRAIIRRDVIARGGAAARLRKKLRTDLHNGRLARCARCGGEFLPSLVDVDHIHPLYQGGEDVEENVQVLCSGRTGSVGCHYIKTMMDADKAPF